jgi:hypothetical protein
MVIIDTIVDIVNTNLLISKFFDFWRSSTWAASPRFRSNGPWKFPPSRLLNVVLAIRAPTKGLYDSAQGLNGAKLSEIWNASSPRRGREASARGFNPGLKPWAESYSPFVGATNRAKIFLNLPPFSSGFILGNGFYHKEP